jgi:hypothetical protein
MMSGLGNRLRCGGREGETTSLSLVWNSCCLPPAGGQLEVRHLDRLLNMYTLAIR